MTVINRLLRSQMFIDKIVLFQRATPSGSYKIVNPIFYKHVILSELIRYFITSLVGVLNLIGEAIQRKQQRLYQINNTKKSLLFLWFPF